LAIFELVVNVYLLPMRLDMKHVVLLALQKMETVALA
jgi:hypothetical protein